MLLCFELSVSIYVCDTGRVDFSGPRSLVDTFQIRILLQKAY